MFGSFFRQVHRIVLRARRAQRRIQYHRVPVFEQLGSRALATHVIGEHIHPNLSIFINGEELPIPKNIGVTQSRIYHPHTHDDTGTIHVGEGRLTGIDPEGSPRRLTILKDFFDVWRTTGTVGTPRNNPNAFFSKDRILDHFADARHTIRMNVNGQVNTEFENYSPHDLDRVVIRYIEVLNNKPRADSKNVSVPFGGQAVINLTGGDGNAEVVQELTFRVRDLPQHGVLHDSGGATVAVGAALPTSKLTYFPNAGFSGADSFIYEIQDNGGTDNGGHDTSDPAEAIIQVLATSNAAPIANPQSVSVASNSSLNIELTGADGDPDAEQVLSFRIESLPQHGTLRDSQGGPIAAGAVMSNAAVSYTPDQGFTGNDLFTFRVLDDGGTANGGRDTSDPADIQIAVTPPVNHAPVANSQTFEADFNSPRSLALTASDGDSDVEQSLIYRIESLPTHGTLQDAGGSELVIGSELVNPSVKYTPQSGFFGNDGFTFVVRDDGGVANGGDDTSDVAQIGLNVLTPVNQQPTANSQSVNVAHNTPKTIQLTGSDGDSEIEQVLYYRVDSLPANGTLQDVAGTNVVAGSLFHNPTVTYIPTPGTSGRDTFQFSVQDDGGTDRGGDNTSEPAVVELQVEAAPTGSPNSLPQSVALRANTSRVITLTAEPGTSGGNPGMQFRINSLPEHGLLHDGSGNAIALNTVLPNDRVTYSPTSAFVGNDDFTFQAQFVGGEAVSTPAPVSLEVVNSIDPNDIVGPVGQGNDQGVVAPDAVLPFTIRFENLASATAPAQQILIQTALDPNLDWSSFRLGDIGLGGMRLEPDPRHDSFSHVESMDSVNSKLDLQVDAQLDPQSGFVTWKLLAIDPTTGKLPDDPFAGILPPNDAAHSGEGFVSFEIQPRHDLNPGSEFGSWATIQFDTNAPIETNHLSYTTR